MNFLVSVRYARMKMWIKNENEKRQEIFLENLLLLPLCSHSDGTLHVFISVALIPRKTEIFVSDVKLLSCIRHGGEKGSFQHLFHFLSIFLKYN